MKSTLNDIYGTAPANTDCLDCLVDVQGKVVIEVTSLGESDWVASVFVPRSDASDEHPSCTAENPSYQVERRGLARAIAAAVRGANVIPRLFVVQEGAP